jgi:hypothetical protein
MYFRTVVSVTDSVLTKARLSRTKFSASFPPLRKKQIHEQIREEALELEQDMNLAISGT